MPIGRIITLYPRNLCVRRRLDSVLDGFDEPQREARDGNDDGYFVRKRCGQDKVEV
jgi:hypothetical protein